MTDAGADVAGAPRFSAKSGSEREHGEPKLDPTPQILEDLIELGHDAEVIVAVGRERFIREDAALYRHAAEGVLIKVQELCDRLPSSFREDRPEVPWAAIRGIRNRLGHDYRSTDYRIVWTALQRALPELIASITA